MQPTEDKTHYDQLVQLCTDAINAYPTCPNATLLTGKHLAELIEVLSLEKKHPEWVGDTTPSKLLPVSVTDSICKYRYPYPKFKTLRGNKRSLASYIHKVLTTAKSVYGKEYDKVLDHIFYIRYNLDGVPCELNYVEGKLVSAIIGGNRIYGKNAVSMATAIPNVPGRVHVTQTICIRGVIVAHKADFANLPIIEGYSEEDYPCKSKLLNLLMQPEVSPTDLAKLKFYATEYTEATTSYSLSQQESILVELGYGLSRTYTGGKMESIIGIINDTNRERLYLPYATVGLTLRVNDPKLRIIIETEAWDPDYDTTGVDYNFDDAPERATVAKLNWVPQYTGELKLEVEFKAPSRYESPAGPIQLLDNTLIRSGIGPGAVVELSDTINPNDITITRVISPVKSDIPNECPCCGQPLSIKHNDQVFCTNPDCPDILVAWLSTIAASDMLDFQLTPAQAKDLIVSKTITKVEDLFLPVDNKSELIDDAALNSIIRRIRAVDFFEFLTIVGAGGTGRVTASKLTMACGTLSKFKQYLEDPELLDKLTIAGYTKTALKEWYAIPRHREIIDNVLALKLPNLC